MKILSEFKAFVMRGNVVDLAVGVIIGAAFGKVIASLVDDVLTPAILTPVLKATHVDNIQQLVIPGTLIRYGNFISNILTYIIVMFALFLLVKLFNSLKKKEEVSSVASIPSREEQLLTEIRDILKSKNQ